MYSTLNRFHLIFYCVANVLILSMTACSFSNQNNLVDQLEGDSNPKAILENLIYENNIIVDVPEIKTYIDVGQVDYFNAVDKYNRTYVTFFLKYPVRGRGNRSFSFTFRQDRTLLKWGKDSIVTTNGGLLDCNADGYLEKIIRFVEEDSQFYTRFFPVRLQIYSLKEEKAELLLDLQYNLASSTGDPNFLLLSVTPGNFDEPSNILLSNLSETEKVEVVYSRKKRAYLVQGNRNKNWKVLYPEGF